MKRSIKILLLLLTLILFLLCYNLINYNPKKIKNIEYTIEDYSGKDYIYINNNEPNFSVIYKTMVPFEIYGKLDHLGRSTYAFANIGIELFPKSKRESISKVRPTAYMVSKYDFIPQKYLYNRCHLIAFSLTGENANKNNLITCTSKMNQGKMKEIEKEVKEYIEKTNNHVLYRVKVMYDYDNLLAKGINLEALSLEDNGEGIKYNLFIYNVQDGVKINYKDGTNYALGI